MPILGALHSYHPFYLDLWGCFLGVLTYHLFNLQNPLAMQVPENWRLLAIGEVNG